ncbi:MAG TPA: 16S rRNA (cytosine(1402)-N(4))-methyltransferase RsmH [Polyangiaceae bacterium]|nr:16S rRNA (cytosine(1402)-N(4))-methyltransferase RsmH [Polyangiaceae bacterium]
MVPPTPRFEHTSVMLEQVLDAIAPQPGGVYLDVTTGGAGHSQALLERCPGARLIAFDRDPAAVRTATERLARFGARATVVHATFSEVEEYLVGERIESVDGLIADLGVSSPQLDDAERGLSFRFEGPLDMRMDPTSGETALEAIERLSQDELADAIYHYGEEHRSRRVARCIKQAFEAGELTTTLDLRRAVVRATGPRRQHGMDPATRTFQALRILVNRELDELEALLAAAPQLVKPGGVAAIMSFHSLEDRLVKRAFAERSTWERLSKKPLIAGAVELNENPRARSAKLRAARRVEGSGLFDDYEPDSSRDSEPPDSSPDVEEAHGVNVFQIRGDAE